MKRRSASLEDVFQELQFTLDDDGRPAARVVRHAYTAAYRMLKAGMLVALGLPWSRGGSQQ